jgi:hypothetical protein
MVRITGKKRRSLILLYSSVDQLTKKSKNIEAPPDSTSLFSVGFILDPSDATLQKPF